MTTPWLMAPPHLLTQPLSSSSFLGPWAIRAELHTAGWRVRLERQVRVPWPSFPHPPSMGNVNSQQTQLLGTCASRQSWTHEGDDTEDSPVHRHRVLSPNAMWEIPCALVKIFCWDFFCVCSPVIWSTSRENSKPYVKGTWVVFHPCVTLNDYTACQGGCIRLCLLMWILLHV